MPEPTAASDGSSLHAAGVPAFDVVNKRLPWTARTLANTWVRTVAILALLAAIWEIYAAVLDNGLLVPRFSVTVQALYTNLANGTLLERGWVSVRILLVGYAVGMLAAALLARIASVSRFGRDFLELLTSMFNPLPAIALLPWP